MIGFGEQTAHTSAPHARPRRTRSAVAVLVPLAAAVALSGCAITPADAYNVALAERAHGEAADFARSLYRGPTDTIDDYARWADDDAAANSSLELIGYEAYPGAEHGEPFGALQVRVTLSDVRGDRFQACFESEFDYWGVTTADPTRWDDDEAVAHPIACPADAGPIDPPVDERAVPVVPEGAEEVVLDVLRNAGPDATAEQVVAAVLERMPSPTGEREVPFDPAALVRDGEIGVAMGDADDCLLAVRRANGEVETLDVPRVLLQPGELGCSADTALMPVDQLRSPH
ncbi:hypothetical protein [Streptomyces sp. AC495_CC817]|uniref:hypothetical protein n=1 Tax=Streptomyces sp. AC495_CC817 TaxID=2823900 RepID=UPI001C26FF82|nr:hypothetical protein [Streptomyces sp. AC495_CC817]